MPGLHISEEQVPEHPKDDSGIQLSLAVDVTDGSQSQALCDLHVGCAGTCVTSPSVTKCLKSGQKLGLERRGCSRLSEWSPGCHL